MSGICCANAGLGPPLLIREIDPIHDARWLALVQRHPQASAFHLPGWLEALRRTYGYQPFVLTTSERDGELQSGLVFCRINSRLTGRRWVSLPFSDHCEPLLDGAQDFEQVLAQLESAADREELKYIEIRPASTTLDRQRGWGFIPSSGFWWHRIDLEASLDRLFNSFHKDCVQRKIRRAEREGLSYEQGTSEALLHKFYGLLLLTRRRHQVLPQPLDWFRNLIRCLGDAVTIRVASKLGRAIASILTLRFRDSLIYKYGCSDSSLSRFGGTQLLFWRAIQEAKDQGIREFDLGRSDYDNPGLVAFKSRWGSTRSELTYWRFPAKPMKESWQSRAGRMGNQVLAHAPASILAAAGNLLYKYVG